ncbi:MAG: signal peptide peptidase SppA [Myxococcota bacterium]
MMMWHQIFMMIAFAQEPTVSTSAVSVRPAAAIAAESSSAALYVNPANLSYNPGFRWGVFAAGDLNASHPLTVVGTAGIGGLQAGLRYVRRFDAATDWQLSLGSTLKLPKRLSIGGSVHWNLLYGADNVLAWDGALSWRPLPWFGMSVVSRNVGNPQPSGQLIPETGVGVAMRPVHDRIVLGVDVLYRPTIEPETVGRVSAALAPTQGFRIRTSLDTSLQWGLGIEVGLGGPTLGLHSRFDGLDSRPSLHLYALNDPQREHIAPSNRRVAQVVFDASPPNTPRQLPFGPSVTSWHDTLDSLEHAGSEGAGVLLTFDGMELSWPRWEELRLSIEHAREGGASVVAYLGRDASEGALYAATGADHILAHPTATLWLTGPHTDLVHWHGALEGLGITTQVLRRGDYKAAAEPMSQVRPSDQQLEQTQTWVDQRFDALVDGLATGRTRSVDVASAWVNHGPWTAADALKAGLIDQTVYPDELNAAAEALFGVKPRWFELPPTNLRGSAWEPPAQIALIHAEGVIVESSPSLRLPGSSFTSAEELVRQLDAAASDIAIRAVVLRVDSPGGSAFASEEIWRAVGHVKRAGKPVVVSMGSVAASGGYYIASHADSIWAMPNTLTGSIGVIATRMSPLPLLEDLGVTQTPVGRGNMSSLSGGLAPWSVAEASHLDGIIGQTYAVFLERVAEGRGMDMDRVATLAGGRVWTGRDAKTHGLVDHLGSLTDAISEARILANVSPGVEIEVLQFRRRPRLDELLLPSPLAGLTTRFMGLPQAGLVLPELDRVVASALTWSVIRRDNGVLWMIDPTLPTTGTR